MRICPCNRALGLFIQQKELYTFAFHCEIDRVNDVIILYLLFCPHIMHVGIPVYIVMAGLDDKHTFVLTKRIFSISSGMKKIYTLHLHLVNSKFNIDQT